MSQAVFYRAVSIAELEDICTSAQFRGFAGACEGKYLTNSVELAEEWWNMLRKLGRTKEAVGGAIVRFVCPAEVAGGFYYCGDDCDGVGPAWYAGEEQLSCITCFKVEKEVR